MFQGIVSLRHPELCAKFQFLTMHATGQTVCGGVVVGGVVWWQKPILVFSLAEQKGFSGTPSYYTLPRNRMVECVTIFSACSYIVHRNWLNIPPHNFAGMCNPFSLLPTCKVKLAAIYCIV